MRTTTTLLLTTLFITACAGERDVPDDGARGAADGRTGDTASAAAQPGVPDDRGDGADHGHGTAAPGEGNTLLAIMQQLGADMAALTHGIMTQDTALVARSAAGIAAHPAMAPEEVERIHAELGAATVEFEHLDHEVHEAAEALHDAARAGRLDAVLDRLHEVQRGCVECHTRFRPRLRTNPGT